MSQRVNIPSQNQPFRRQSSIGGNVSFRNIGENEDNSFITLAKVTRVYYKQGKLDFKLTNTNSLVADQSGNGSGSAPIPVDFFGRRPNGKVFGHYRPVKIGDLIAVAYVNGHKTSPIVIGVYPNSGQDYEIISPSLYLDGDDNDSGVAETALAEQKIYPSMQLEYRSGSGTIAKALNGHSFLVVDDETSVQYSKLWQNYNTVGFFHSNSDDINPLKETAGDWLLIHEDNPLSDDGDNHRTRFFVNKKGEIQVVLMDNTSSGTISVLEGSKDNGFTISQYYDLTKTKSGDLSDDVYEPDFKSATDYVSLNIGKGKQIALDAAGQTKLIIKKDGIYYNGKPLSKAVISDESNSITNYVKDQITSSDDWKNFQDTINRASSEARAAAEQAKQAGENAKAAGAAAEAAGEDAKNTGEDIKKHIIYYASAFPQGDHYIPGKYLAINTETYIADGIIKSAMIENGAIDNAKIASEAVGSSQIEDAAITRAKIADLAVGTAQIEDAAITDAKIGSLSADKITTGTLDAGKINVVNLNAKSITAGTITADKLKIGQLSDITGDAGQITDGRIIVKGNGKNSGVSLEGLDADNPDVYTPSKKAVLANIVHAIKSSAEASLDYAKQVGLSNDPAAIDLQNKYDAMIGGLAPIFNHMDVSTNFDHNTVEQLTSECNYAIVKFQNLANSQLNRKIGQTADNKNSVYQGYEQPANPHNNDIWFQENSDGTYQIKVYDGGSWISPGMKDIKEVQESVSTLPRAYYSSTQPTGIDYKDGDIWYKTSTDTTNNTVVYTAYKWNHNTNTWDPLLDATSSHNYVGSEPASPLEGDFWMDNTTLKQYQNGDWKTIPTQGPQGVPGVSAKQQYIHIAYATSANGENFSSSTFNGATYIGLLVDFNEEDSSDHTKYTWSRLKGADGTDGKDGVPGKPGADGKTSYVHFAYANSSDGNTDFNLEYFANALYVGTYTDFTESDSKDHTKYTWSRLKGDKGANGKDGIAGKDGVGLKRTEVTYGLSESDSTQPSRWSSQVPDLVKGQYLWSKTVWTYTDDTSETGYQKTYIAKDGNDGTDGIAGKDGVGIRSTTITYAVGTSGTTAPTSGWNSQVPNVPVGQYLWTKTIWSYTDNTNETGYSVAKMGDTGPKGDPGKDGVPGKPGADGKTYYTWIKYATDSSGSNISDSPTGMSYIGIAYNKESQTESSTPTDYTWTKIKGDDGIPGKPGADGKTSYFHIAYANSADGKKGFYIGGGQNLLLGTGTASGDVASGGGIDAKGAFNGYDAVKTSTAWSERFINLQSALGRTNAKAGDWYTISVYVKADKQINTGGLAVYRALGNGNAGDNDGFLDGIPMQAKPITTQWQQYSWSFQINDISLQRQITRVEYNQDTGDNWIYWAGWMLEKGSVAHPWSPAPSEVHPLYMGTYTDYTRAGSTDPTRYTWVPMFDSTKKRNFTSQPTTPYAVGDTWTESGATYFCTTARDSGAFRHDDWTMQQLTIQSLAPSVTNSLYNDNLLLGTGNHTATGTGPSYAGGYLSNETIDDLLTLFKGLEGQTVTVSVDYEYSEFIAGSNNNRLGWEIQIIGDTAPYVGPWYYPTNGSGSGRISSTFVVPKNITSIGEGWGYIQFSGSGTGTVSHLKLEKGSVATPWCLSQSELTTTTRDYKGVTLNDSGLTATAGSTTVAMNSNDGFLIKKKDVGEIFHVDTSGNLALKGDITAGHSPNSTISGVNFTGKNLTLTGLLEVSGSISTNNGNAVINSNGLTLKDGGLKIVNSNNETTTEIKDDGTFATNKGYFSGTITGSNIILNNNDGSVINANGGAFMVDGAGNVTAKSISITGNRWDDVSKLATIKGANITGNNLIQGNTITGNAIVGNTIAGGEFKSTGNMRNGKNVLGISVQLDDTPKFSISSDGNYESHVYYNSKISELSLHRIVNSNKEVPYINLTNEYFDRNTSSGTIGEGKQYESPVPDDYGMDPKYPKTYSGEVNLTMTHINDGGITYDPNDNKPVDPFGNYYYTEIAEIKNMNLLKNPKEAFLSVKFDIVNTYGQYTQVPKGDVYLVMTKERLTPSTGGDLSVTYNVKEIQSKISTATPRGTSTEYKAQLVPVMKFNGVRFNFDLYAEVGFNELDLSDTYYFGLLQTGLGKSRSADQNNISWKFQSDRMGLNTNSMGAEDVYILRKAIQGNHGYIEDNFQINPNGSIRAYDSYYDQSMNLTSRHITFNTNNSSSQPYWTTVNGEGIGFSISGDAGARHAIYFSGDNNIDGLTFDGYGNIHAQVGAGIWRIYNNQGDEVFNVPFDPNGVFNFYVPRVNKNQDPGHRWEGLKIGWVYFDQPQYRWAETVPAIYNTGGRVKGIAMFGDFIISFLDGWCYQLSSWWNHGVPNGVDSSKGEAQGTNTDAGYRGV